MRKRSHAFLLLAIALAWKWQIASNPWAYSLKNNHGDRMIKKLLNSVIAKYRDFLCCFSLNVNQHYLNKSRHCCSRAISLLNWFNKVSKYTFSVNFFLYLCFINWTKAKCIFLVTVFCEFICEAKFFSLILFCLFFFYIYMITNLTQWFSNWVQAIATFPSGSFAVDNEDHLPLILGIICGTLQGY